MLGRRRRGQGRLVTALVVLGLAAGAQLAAPPPRETRDTSYTVRPLDPTGMSCRVITSSDLYFIRLSKTGDPDADIDDNVGNGGPTLDQREVIHPLAPRWRVAVDPGGAG